MKCNVDRIYHCKYSSQHPTFNPRIISPLKGWADFHVQNWCSSGFCIFSCPEDGPGPPVLFRHVFCGQRGSVLWRGGGGTREGEPEKSLRYRWVTQICHIVPFPYLMVAFLLFFLTTHGYCSHFRNASLVRSERRKQAAQGSMCSTGQFDRKCWSQPSQRRQRGGRGKRGREVRSLCKQSGNWASERGTIA